MLSERTIINGLLLIGGMILGPYLIVLTLEVNQIALLSFCSLAFLFSVFFFVKDRVAIFPFLAGCFVGSLNFLPLGFTLIEVLSLVAIFYYFINYVILKRRPITAGPYLFLIPLFVVGAIVLYHDRKLGLKVFGGTEEGSRPGLFILVAIVTYLCAINIPSPSVKFLRRVPLYCFLLTFVSSVPFILTTFFPSLAPIVYYISGNVNLTAYSNSVTGADAVDVARNGAIAGIGTSLEAIILCYFPIGTWWRPQRWIFIFVSIICLGCVLLSGYRNNLFSFSLLVFFGAIAYSRWRVLILLPLLAFVPLAVIIVQNDHPDGWTLPASVQRSMSFLPSPWDPDIVASAESSNDFRADIKRVYLSEYFLQSPWIGNGFTFDPHEPEGLTTMSDNATNGDDHQYFQTKAFIVSKNFHIGWISLYDAVGIIGGLAFILFSLALIWTAALLVFGETEDTRTRIFPLKVYLFSTLLTSSIGYFTTFGSFSQSFIGMCGTAVVLVHIRSIQNQKTSTAISLPSQVPTIINHREIFPSLPTSTQ